MADPLATAEDLATYLHHDVDRSRAEMVLTMASSAIRSVTNQTITKVVDDVVRLRVIQDKVVVPQRPVVAVTKVERIDPLGTVTPIAVPGWGFDGIDTVYGAGHMSWIINLPEAWAETKWPTILQVTYTHGYDTVPEDVWGVCLAVAGRGYETQSAGAYQSERVGDYSYRTQVGSSMAFTPEEERILAPYGARQKSSTVPLR